MPWNNYTDTNNFDSESFLFNQYAKYPKKLKEFNLFVVEKNMDGGVMLLDLETTI